MKTKLSALALSLFLAGHGFAAEGMAPHSLPLSTNAKSAIDGQVAAGEYATTFTDSRTGITVSWQADAQNLYVGLRSPGKGWIAIGFGATGMKGASMVVGYVNKAGQWIAEEQMGKAFYRHSTVENPKLIAGSADLKNGKTVLEFALPLALSNGQTIQPGKPMPFVLAFHKTKTKLSKHSRKASAQLVLQANPNAP